MLTSGDLRTPYNDFLTILKVYKKSVTETAILYLPLAQSIAIACFATLAITGIHYLCERQTFALSASLIGVTALYGSGFLYATIIEYLHHGYDMHAPKNKGWEIFKKKHLYHHRCFKKNFTTTDASLMTTVTTWWGTFPMLFGSHYVIVLTLIKISMISLSPWYQVAFFAGITSEFLFFEIRHFVMHIKNSKLAWINTEGEKEHHKQHHEFPRKNFAVTLPILDRLFGTNA